MIEDNWTSVWRSRRVSWVGSILFCCFGEVLGQCSWGQAPVLATTSPQKVQPSSANLFAEDLEILSKRMGVAFVAEGEPFPVSGDRLAPSLSASLSQEDAVKEVTDYFDYSAVRQGNVYLLTKRYTNPEDLPDVSPSESRRGLKALSKSLAAFNPKYPQSDFGNYPQATIGHLLSADQLDRLGKSGLPVSELTPAQHAEVWRLALNFFVQTNADSIDEAYSYVESRNPSDPVFHWQTIMKVHAFGYDTRSANLNKMLFIPVSDSNQIAVYPNGGTRRRINGISTENGVPPPRTDPTDPTLLSQPTKLFLDDNGKGSHTVTIAQALAALNRRATNHGVYKVDAMYASKHVTLVDTAPLTSEVLMRALAAVYGLRIAHKDENSFVLTAPLTIEAKQLTDLGRAIQSTIPDPIYRAIRARSLSTPNKINGPERPVLLNDYLTRSSAIFQTAMRMFRYVAEPKVKSQPGERLALSHLGEQAYNMFELAQVMSMFARACWLADRPLPPYVADIDRITLTGGIYRSADGSEHFSLYLSNIDPKTGQKYQGVGFSNAPVP